MFGTKLCTRFGALKNYSNRIVYGTTRIQKCGLINDVWRQNISLPETSNKIATIHNDIPLTYDELEFHTSNLCNLLSDSPYNLSKGDIVAYFDNSSLDNTQIMLACSLLGLTYIPCSTSLTPQELQALLNEMQPNLIISEKKYENIFSNVTTQSQIIYKQFSRNNWLANESPYNKTKYNYSTATHINYEKDIYTINFTSGTTGDPKGCCYSYTAFDTFSKNLFDIKNIKKYYKNGESNNFSSLILNLPSGGVGSAYRWWTLRNNGTIVFPDIDKRTDINHWYELCQKYNIENLFVFGSYIDEIANYDKIFSTLKSLQFAGCVIPYNVIKKLCEKYGNNTCLVNNYGSVETGPMTFYECNNFDFTTPNSTYIENVPIGKSVNSDDVELKLINQNSEGIGEVICKSKSQMSYYFNKPSETSKKINEDGWVYTNDLCRYDENNELVFIARDKDIIVLGIDAQTIYPSDIEHILSTNFAHIIDSIAVVGLPNELRNDVDIYTGEVPVAFITLQDEYKNKNEQVIKLLEKESKNLLSDILQVYKFEIIDQMPRNQNNKVLKRVLVDQLKMSLMKKL